MDLAIIINIFNNGADDDIKFICTGIIPNFNAEQVIALRNAMIIDGWGLMQHRIGERTYVWKKHDGIEERPLHYPNSIIKYKRVYYQIPK